MITAVFQSLGDARNVLRRVCGDKVADQSGPIWGLNAEGEVNGVWRDLGVPGLWYMLGTACMFSPNRKLNVSLDRESCALSFPFEARSPS